MDGVTFLVLVCPVLLDRGGDSTWLGWLSSIPTCVLCARFHSSNNWRGYVVSLQYIFCNVMPKAWLER